MRGRNRPPQAPAGGVDVAALPEVVLCVGKKRSGKSHLARVLAEQLILEGVAQRALYLDRTRQPQYDGPLLTSVADVVKYPTSPRWVFRWPCVAGDVCGFAMRLRERRPAERLVVVIDEATDSDVSTGNGRWASRGVEELFHRGRGIWIITCTQRPAGIATGISALTEGYFLFTVTHGNDLRRLLDDRLPERVVNQLPYLPRFSYLRSSPGDD